jgi:hypothetical protein
MPFKEKDIQNSKIIEQNLIPLLEDGAAVNFCVTLFQIAQYFDDIYDEGKLEKNECLDLIFKSLFELPANLFYSAHQDKLQPLIVSMFLQWVSANEIEEQKGELEKSYMLRSNLYQIYHFCGLLLKGKDYAINNALTFQGLYGEKFNDYKEEIK